MIRRQFASLLWMFVVLIGVSSMHGGEPVKIVLPDGGADELAFSPDGKRLAALVRVTHYQRRSSITLWNGESGECEKTLYVPYNTPAFVIPARFTALAFSPDGQELHAVAEVGYYVWGTEQFEQRKRVRILGAESLAISPDGEQLAFGLDDGRVSYRRLTARQHREGSKVWSVAWSPDGSMLASASTDGRACLWNDVGEIHAGPWRHEGYVYCIRFSPDGKFVATGDNEAVRIWDAQSGESVAVVDSSARQVRAVAFSPDGSTLACSMNSSIVLIEVGSWRTGDQLQGHRTYIQSLVYAPDGKRLASGDQDGVVKLWSR